MRINCELQLPGFRTATVEEMKRRELDANYREPFGESDRNFTTGTVVLRGITAAKHHYRKDLMPPALRKEPVRLGGRLIKTISVQNPEILAAKRSHSLNIFAGRALSVQYVQRLRPIAHRV
jgi:hypothetical protein